MINSWFSIIFPKAWYKYLPRKSSDHCPIVLRFHKEFPRYAPSPFRFQNMWCSHDSFRALLVEAVWREPIRYHGLLKLAAKLKKLKLALQNWNKTVFGRVDLHIKELEVKLEDLERHLQCGFSDTVEADYLLTKMELETWEGREETCLSQKAKKAWLDNSYPNSKFFHATVTQRRKNTFISSMSLLDGTV